MEIRDLEAFLAVIEHNGYRRAADALYVSQPSLTRKVVRLEQELKVSLLERGPHGIRPTQHGMRLARGARKVLAAAEEARALATGTWNNQISLSCTATAANAYVSEFLASWIPRHPDTRIQIIEDAPHANRRRLSENVADLAIFTAPVETEFESLPLTQFQVHALIPPGHRLAHGRSAVSVEDLATEPLLVTGRNYRSARLLMSACHVAGLRPKIVLECTSGSTLAFLAQAGIGIAILSSASYKPGPPLIALPLRSAEGAPFGFHVRIAWSRARELSPQMREFVHAFSEFTRARRNAETGQPIPPSEA